MIGVENIESHLTEFWKLVQKDVLPGQDKEVCEAGLSALTQVVSLLSKHESNKDILVKFLGDIIGGKKYFIFWLAVFSITKSEKYICFSYQIAGQ